jgi:hypothetical protein
MDMHETITRYRLAGLDYDFARALERLVFESGDRNVDDLVQFEILWPQLQHVCPPNGRWVEKKDGKWVPTTDPYA